ncbi:MAG: hypothetical protein U9Q71_11010, partial [Pseudomonadota bacterium]|nr:hypothetical protein [Pseudomonadota bacterium]
DSTLKNSMDYVRTLQDNCARTDGYKCADEAAIREFGNAILPGNYVKVWNICYDDFLKIEDLTEEQKQLRHYNIRVAEDKKHYLVEFQGLLLPYIDQGKPADVLMSVFGRSTKYWVRKDTFEIAKRLFYK